MNKTQTGGDENEYRDSCLLCFTETRLKDTIDDSLLVRTDHDPLVTGKKVGGGVCVYVNERWCKNIPDEFPGCGRRYI